MKLKKVCISFGFQLGLHVQFTRYDISKENIRNLLI